MSGRNTEELTKALRFLVTRRNRNTSEIKRLSAEIVTDTRDIDKALHELSLALRPREGGMV